MRITNQLTYLQNINRYQTMQNDINKANNRLVDDRKFHEAYDDSAAFSESMRLDNEVSTFEQVKTASDKAVSFSKNSDQAMNEITKSLDEFKSKLIQSANEVHSQTSLNAIANDLQEIKNHIINITNTSINGQYLFSGTAINIKPFDSEGNYHGNQENINVLLGSNVQQPYNISGAELIKGKDNDYRTTITTNERLLDRRYDVNDPTQIHYLNAHNKIRDLIGKNYLAKNEQNKLDENNNFFGKEHFPPTYFYLSGTKGDGSSFRAKFSMQENEDLSALLKRIGEVYGNTEQNQLVKVELNKSGLIEITDLAHDNSRLNFSMFAVTKTSQSAEIFYDEDKNAKAAAAAASGEHKIPALDLTPGLNVDENGEVKDIADANSLAQIKQLEQDGKVFVLNFCDNARLNSSGVDDASNYAKVQFSAKDQYLRSNITQRNHNGQIAKDDDLLINCQSAPIQTDLNQPHTVLEADITSSTLKKYHISIDLTEASVHYEDNGKQRTIDLTHKIYDQARHKTYRIKSKANEVTFAQINDVISLFASDNLPKDNLLANQQLPQNVGQGFELSEQNSAQLDTLLQKAKEQVNVSLKDGRLQLEDKSATSTKIQLAIYDHFNNADEFNIPAGSISKSADSFTFATNSSLIVDEPQLDIIKDLDKMIEAVRAGEYRSDASSHKQNPGIQAAIRRLDHISDHVRKVHTKIGSIQSAIEAARDRAEAMQTNIKEVKSIIMGSGPDGQAQALLELKNMMNNFSAILQTSAMINKLSLLDYMR